MTKDFKQALDNCTSNKDRALLAADTSCPPWLLDIFANYELDYLVLKSLLENSSLPDYQKKLAESRLTDIEKDYRNKKKWHDLLSASTYPEQRVDITLLDDCPEWMLEILITQDNDDSVILAAVEKTTNDELKLLGETRAKKLQQSENNTLCPIPWNHLSIQQNGDLRICCMCISSPFGRMTTEDGQVANISNIKLNDARNLEEVKELRKSMIAGEKHSLCNQCWEHEAVGLPSKRKHMLKVYGSDSWKIADVTGTIDTEEFPLTYMDIRFGNVCNLKCRSCGPTDSTLWYDDFLSLSNKPVATMVYYNKEYKIGVRGHKAEILENQEDFEWYEQDKFWNEIEHIAPTLDRMYFTGGEPSINKTHFKLLEYLIENNYSKNIVLEYNSNMVAIPDKLYSWWEKFKSVGIGCSIDGIGNMAGYLRPPSSWDRLEVSLDKLGYNKVDTITGSISTTVSIYNVIHILDIIKWLDSKNYTNITNLLSFHMLEGPTHMNVQALSAKDKQYVVNEYNKFYGELERTHGRLKMVSIKRAYGGILTHMLSKDLSYALPNLKNATHRVDNIRNEKLADVNPWLANILDNLK